MIIEQLYTDCLSEAAYYIESEGEVAIIDPLRETSPYIDKAKENKAKIKYIFETHFHADFVSGHVDLAKKTNATIVFGPSADTDYDCHIAVDNEVFTIGNITLTLLHTPGHTLESSTFLLKDEKGKNHAIFTGDTLFIGDVGRPDLAISNGLTEEYLAGKLYDSLREKIMPLQDDVLVYPAHGQGSSCGKSMSEETFSTLGVQKRSNYALQDVSKEEFVEQLISEILPAPQYFSKNAMMNKSGYESFDNAIRKGNKALSLKEFERKMHAGALVIDTREMDQFSKGYIPDSIFIGMGGYFAPWVGTLVTEMETPILLITELGKEEEAVTRLARVGYDNAQGYLSGGFKTWEESGKRIDTVKTCSVEQLKDVYGKQQSEILDIRRPSEYQISHIKGIQNFPLDFINNEIESLNKKQPYHFYCRIGYRALIAISILKRHGYTNLTNIEGGYDEIVNTKIPLEEAELV